MLTTAGVPTEATVIVSAINRTISSSICAVLFTTNVPGILEVEFDQTFWLVVLPISIGEEAGMPTPLQAIVLELLFVAPGPLAIKHTSKIEVKLGNVTPAADWSSHCTDKRPAVLELKEPQDIPANP